MKVRLLHRKPVCALCENTRRVRRAMHVRENAWKIVEHACPKCVEAGHVKPTKEDLVFL